MTGSCRTLLAALPLSVKGFMTADELLQSLPQCRLLALAADCQCCGPVQLSTKGLLSVDELRRGIEQLPEAAYKHRSYYEKWAASVASIQMERGNISQRDIDAAMGKPVTEPEVK